ncbi:hypothetical protein EG329_005316 [Mollisiaceae sp. DMI_Dod_QoI]|nr:hypothetical protein EG329_005316 [Helotiales sp. DMI_Dod_QoI]
MEKSTRPDRTAVAGYSILSPRARARLAVKTASIPSALATDNTALNPELTKVLALIDLQSFDGTWNIDSEKPLLDLTGLDVTKSPPNGVSDEIWVTIVVLRFLEDRIPKEEDVWGLVVEKARACIQRYLGPGGDLQLLEELAARVVVEEGKTGG